MRLLAPAARLAPLLFVFRWSTGFLGAKYGPPQAWLLFGATLSGRTLADMAFAVWGVYLSRR